MPRTLLDEFDDEFYPKLGNTRRWPAFRYIAERLLAIESPFILETGCLRQIDN